MSEFNLPLLRKAVEWAESEARKPIEQSEWCQEFFAVLGRRIGRDCGTAYCIAGYVAEQAGLPSFDSSVTAMNLLGIELEDAWGNFDWDERTGHHGLFAASNSIEDVREIAEQIARKYGEEL